MPLYINPISTSAGLAAQITNETGSGALVFATTPSFTTTIGVGAATASASGSGISFPGTQSASTDVNTLDDYEEGTWTPSVGGNSTYTTQTGHYTKIGRLVFVSFQLTINVLGTGSTSTITGLPFTAAGGLQSQLACTYSTGLAAAVTSIGGYVSNGTTQIVLAGRTAGNASVTDGIAALGNSSIICLSGCYISA